MAFEDIGVATYHMSQGFSDIDLLPVNPGLMAFFGRSENGGLVEFVYRAEDKPLGQDVSNVDIL